MRMVTKHVMYNFLLCRFLGELTLVSRDFNFLKPNDFEGYCVSLFEGTYHFLVYVPFAEGDIGLCTIRSLCLQYVPGIAFLVRDDFDMIDSRYVEK